MTRFEKLPRIRVVVPKHDRKWEVTGPRKKTLDGVVKRGEFGARCNGDEAREGPQVTGSI